MKVRELIAELTNLHNPEAEVEARLIEFTIEVNGLIPSDDVAKVYLDCED